MNVVTTQCPRCLSRWSGTLEQVLHNDRVCLKCSPIKHPDTVLIDWIQRTPNPRLHQVVDAWIKCLGNKISLRGAIEYCIENLKPKYE